jgi:hypothetical protein
MVNLTDVGEARLTWVARRYQRRSRWSMASSARCLRPRPMAEAVRCSSYALVGHELLGGTLPPGEDFFPRCIETHWPAP